MALGEVLKSARMRKKLTASEVASETRMKVQTVNELENEDFSKMAAPVYAKGFIRLYAEFVGLDPAELIQEYVERFVEGPKPTSEVEMEPSLPIDELEPVAPPPAPAPEPPAPRPPEAAEPSREASFFDDDPDLFSEVEPASAERRGILMDDGYREVTPPLRERAGQATANAVDAARQAGDQAGAACRRFCAGGVAFVVNGVKHLIATVGARRKELSQIDFKNLSAKHMMALLGILVLVLFVISSLSRCVRGQGGPGTADRAPVPPVAAEPVDVYLD